jgi:O-antigen/teichoic acid export membrane protein
VRTLTTKHREDTAPATDAAAAPASGAMLQTHVVRGVKWKAASLVAGQGSKILVGLILARLLTPHDFGVAAMVMVFASLVIVFSDLALGAALVQRPSLTRTDASTAFWFSALSGAVFTAIGIAIAPAVARFYHTPEVKSLFAVLSITFLIASLGATQTALLTRAMDFAALEIRMIIGTIGGGIVGVVLAVLGYGPWAIIAQQVASTFLSTALLWGMSSWRPGFRFSFDSLHKLGGFSANVFGQRLMYFVHRNVDNLLIGRYAGSVALGAYSLAYTLMLAPLSRIAVPVQQVMYPALSQMQHDKRWLAGAWTRVSRAVGAISIPSMVGLAVVAPDFVDVVLGSKWAIAIPLIQILSWVGLVQSVQALNTDLLQAVDRTGVLFRYTLLFFAAHLTAFVIGLQWGVVGVATGYAISTTLVEPISTVVTARALGVSAWSFLRALLPVAGAAAGMAGIALATRYLLIAAGAGAAIRLFVVVAVGVAVYVPLLALAAGDVLRDVKALARRASDSRRSAVNDLPLVPSDA